MTNGIGGSGMEAELGGMQPWADTAAPIGDGEFESRIDKARRLLAEEGADALLVGAGDSLRYFSGIPVPATERLVALLVPREGDPVLIAPAFEEGTLLASLKIEADFRGWEEHEDPHRLTADALDSLGTRTVLADPMLPHGVVLRLRAAASRASFGDGTGLIDACRTVKSASEIALLQQAKSMTLEVHRRTARILRPGIRASEVRRFIDEAHRALGASGSSFCIVLFGEATSYPHGVPGDPVLEEGDVVLIDTGCRVDGYHSDITRSYVYGKADAEQRRIWDLEREAQLAAFAAARPGAPCEAVDEAARNVLIEGGLGPGYALPGLPHRTGHGIGLSIHEAPYLVRGDATPLAPGMCFSNEPMIVVPGRFGIRLEDHFYMAEEGPRWFTEPSPSLDAPFGP
ncbi:M24 family metallopeptidase [Parvularcula oceani]|uniref:M24 family metallopeptidase n=1 Tax=Parvularcula oceani TaxID=1247963 RepID=UPI0004E11647|nr:Xaa-Pro peptidase family protein [Parvularcula oceani]